MEPGQDDDTVYRVMVNAEVEMPIDKAADLFASSHVEGIERIGPAQYEIAVALEAPNYGEAYKRATDYVESTARLALQTNFYNVHGATVHGPLEEKDGVTFD